MLNKDEPRAEPPFTPRALELLTKGKNPREGYQTLVDGARIYFLLLQQALNPFPAADAALLIHLCRHIANELERQNPTAKELATQFKQHLKLPPVEIE